MILQSGSLLLPGFMVDQTVTEMGVSFFINYHVFLAKNIELLFFLLNNLSDCSYQLIKLSGNSSDLDFHSFFKILPLNIYSVLH